MIRIKYFLTCVGISFLFFSFSNCGSSSTNDSKITFEKNPPFTLGTIFYQDWVAGIRDGGSGTNVHIAVKNQARDVVFKKIYFRNKVEKVTHTPADFFALIGYFKNNKKPAIIMDEDPIKEAQNTPPAMNLFQLKDDESVLEYSFRGKTQYFKIVNMIRKDLLAYPSSNPNGID